MAPPSDRPPYIPPRYLSAGSFLTPQQLISEYEEFSDSLRYVSTAPELVFERLVANLKDTFSTALELERQKHSAALQEYVDKTKEGNSEAKVSGVGEGSTAVGTAVNAGTSESGGPVVGHYKGTMAGVSYNSFGYGRLFRFDSFGIPLRLQYLSPPELPIISTIVELDIISKQYPGYTTTINSIEAPFQAGRSEYLEIGVNWLETGADDSDIQQGEIASPTGFNPSEQGSQSLKRITVNFQRQYATIPLVTVWFSDFIYEKPGQLERFQAQVSATHITTTNFVISFLSPQPEGCSIPIFAWVAYPTHRKDVFKGRFSTKVRSENTNSCDHAYESFPGCRFATPPRILMGFDSLDVEAPDGLIVVETDVTGVTEKGMSWHIKAHMPTKLNSASVTYLAFG